jgi:hypothetical protein
MSHPVDPKLFGLHHTTQLEQSGEKEFVIVMNRKSRIIMKDGGKIVQKATRIIEKAPGAIVNLRTTAPVCSKTKVHLQANKVEIIE